MIVIKTKLKEMPKDCMHCSAEYDLDCPHITCWDMMPRREDSRPDDCPLIDLEVNNERL